MPTTVRRTSTRTHTFTHVHHTSSEQLTTFCPRPTRFIIINIIEHSHFFD
jgi:hypothetical protein